MAIIVRANNFVEADVHIKNIGQLSGTFRVNASAVFHGGTLTQQMFFNTKGYSSSNPAPAGAQFVTTELVSPNSIAIVKMYSDKWLSIWVPGQLFDIIYTIKVIETNILYKVTGANILQFST